MSDSPTSQVPSVTSGRLRRAARATPTTPGSAKRLISMLATLADLGWQRSARTGAPVDGSDRPLPWFTYPAITWLEHRLRPTDSVFEFGAGNSTLWFAPRVQTVISVEHDAAWVQRLEARLPLNVTLLHRRDPGDGVLAKQGDYLEPLTSATDLFDVIVVDARARQSCLEAAAGKVATDGIVVLDNSDRPAYQAGIAIMHAEGFGRIDFLGPAPGSGRLGVTSVFLRDPARWITPNVPIPHVGY